ncbi:2,3-bisphosphoglycerate-independent phosphoglycerate mutase [Candidatus Berkelbacteria bacterium]|nr:2,3-bisphosphoglycerate-independent phosphoglycerate mutase [Candidatus Berkelbacteria bacterium]
MNELKKTADNSHRPVVLIILDGWGLSPAWGGNAISMQNPSFINELYREYPHFILQSFSALNNPYQKVGNSEIGHTAIGCGQMVDQDLVEISLAIKKKTFFQNEIIKRALKRTKNEGKKVHLIGLYSKGAVHSHLDHILALIDFARQEGIFNLYLHLILDGQDSEMAAFSGDMFLLREKIKEAGLGKVASLTGRFFAMDRDGHLDLTDFNFPPTTLFENAKLVTKIRDGDLVIFANTRAERMQQLVRAFADFHYLRRFGLLRQFPVVKATYITLTDYHLDLPLLIAFPHRKINHNLAKIISAYGLSQLHVAESEKRAHITYFLNGGFDEPFQGEDWLIIPSPKVAGFNQTPAMKAPEIIDSIIRRLKKYDFIATNLANVDLISHTGDILATAKAVEVIDQQLKKLAAAVLKAGGVLLITADHGNAEQMVHLSPNADPETVHSLNPVPLILVGGDFEKPFHSLSNGFGSEIVSSRHTLADVAPTVLELLGLKIPQEMTGESLLDKH